MNVFSLSFHFVNGHSYHSLNCCVIQGLFLHFLSCSVWFPDVSYTSAMLINWMNFIICFIIHSILTFILLFQITLTLYKLKNICQIPKKVPWHFYFDSIKTKYVFRENWLSEILYHYFSNFLFFFNYFVIFSSNVHIYVHDFFLCILYIMSGHLTFLLRYENNPFQ